MDEPTYFFTHELWGVYKIADGILGIKLKETFTDFSIGIMANYLSPATYSYGLEAEAYFNNCAVLWDTLSALQWPLLLSHGSSPRNVQVGILHTLHSFSGPTNLVF